MKFFTKFPGHGSENARSYRILFMSIITAALLSNRT